MRVDQAQSLETQRRGAESFQIRYQYAFVVADYDSIDLALAVDEQTDLPVDVEGKKG